MQPNLISIDTPYLNQVKLALAFPDVDNLLLGDEQIKEYAVYPAMYEYFKKFPKLEYFEETLGTTESTYDFPDDETFGAIQVRTVDKGYSGSSNGSYPFWETYFFNRSTASYKRSNYGTSYDFGGMGRSYLAQRQLRDSYIENLGNFRYNIDTDNRIVTVYASIYCKILIVWAKNSNKFSDVKFEYQRDVIDLAQAYLLQHAADATGIAPNSAMELTVDTGELKSKAEERFTRIRDKWEQIPHPFIMNFR